RSRDAAGQPRLRRPRPQRRRRRRPHRSGGRTGIGRQLHPRGQQRQPPPRPRRIHRAPAPLRSQAAGDSRPLRPGPNPDLPPHAGRRPAAQRVTRATVASRSRRPRPLQSRLPPPHGYPMASSLLVLLDDIATILDDVAAMTKVAAKKTAGVLGDDLALNAEQVSGVRAARELPVVWAVAKGSAVNKAILVPAALAISAFLPWLVTPLLMAGGLFLCYEGAEKLAHKFLHSRSDDTAHHAAHAQALAKSDAELLAQEKGKIKGAIRTDFIL